MRWTLNGTQSNMALPFTVQMAKTRFGFRSSVENAENVQVANQTWSVMRSTFDQILDYGIYFGAQEGEFAAETIARLLSEGTRTNDNPFVEYEALCDQGNDITQDFIDCLWE